MKLAEDYYNTDEFDLIESKNFNESRDNIITKMLQDSLDLVVSALSLTHSGYKDVKKGASIDGSRIADKSFLDLINAYHLITFCSYNKIIRTDIISEDQAKFLSKIGLELSGLFYILTGIINKVFFEQKQSNKDIPNFIKGRLDSKKYIQQYSKYSDSNLVPCIIRERKYDSIENLAVCVSIILALKKVSQIHYTYLKEYPKSDVTQVVNRIYFRLNKFLNNEFFFQSMEKASQLVRYNDKSSIEKFADKLKSKFAHDKIKNKYYFALITWIEIFNRFDDNISNISIDYLLPLSEDKNQTVNVLFEYWVLKQIITGLEEKEKSGEVKIIKIKPLASRDNETTNLKKFICNFTYKNNKYFLYFQHTADICYDESIPPIWKKINISGIPEPLGGRPDYSILIEGDDGAHKKTIIIDAKNKPGNRTGTEEVYKIIGYFDNYIGKLGDDAKGILIFRKNKGQSNWKEDFDSVYEKTRNDKKAKIWKFGIDPLDNSEDLVLRRKYIMDAIFE